MGFAVRGHEASLWLTERGLTYRLHPAGEVSEGAAGSWVVGLDLVGATPRPPVGEDPLPTRVSYFKGPRDQWRTGLPSYGSVVYREPWPGVDLVVSGTAGELESTFVVRPGVDARAIRLAYRGASAVSLNPDGGLTVETPLGPIDELAPVAWQEVDGRRVEVAAAFELEEGDEPGRQAYGFRLGPYDPTRELVVDPVTLMYCGYIGGSGGDAVLDVVVDAVGNLYVSGATDSSEATFPVAVGPDLIWNGDLDAFIAKVRPDGSGLEYCGYIGGSGYDEGDNIAIDPAGNVYIAGLTWSTQATFPVAVGPDLTHNGERDAFVAKLNAAGTDLEYCGYIGGSGVDWSSGGIAVDGSGRAYVVGNTSSTQATFPVAVGPDLTYNGGDRDSFVARVNAAGTALEYCGYIGGSGWEEPHGMALDSAGRVYVIGSTFSTGSTFPVTVGPDLTYNGGEDAFVARVNAAGTALEYCGYVGGSGEDNGASVDVDPAGHAYLTGYTNSTEGSFPLAVGPDVTYNGGFDAFIARVSATGDTLDRCGYLGGSEDDGGCDIALDAAGNVYVAGVTASDETSFPVLEGPDLTYNEGATDVFVARVDAAGEDLDYCGYIGGSGQDSGGTLPFTQDLAVDSYGNAYVAGTTASTDGSFPTVVGPDLTYNGGTWDAFVAKVTPLDLIFADGFESGDTSGWSATVP